jgi:hypothetical protein
MTNNISSADEAMLALMKVKAKSIPVRVNIAFPSAAFSFEGLVTAVDPSGLQIWGVGPRPALFRIAPLSAFSFFGEFDEGTFIISLVLAITRHGLPIEDQQSAHFHLYAEWPPRPNTENTEIFN